MDVTKEALVREMESYFDGDTRRIDHAHRVTAYAEQLLGPEGGDYQIVIGAGVLHDIGIPEAVKKYGSPSGKYQEKEGPPIARRILTGLGLEPGQIDEICEIIAHHHSPGKVDTRNFKILYDADWLVNLKSEHDISDKAKLAGIIDRVFLTDSGRSLARETYLSEPGS
ncbi:MAG: HD domain-containing protein [Dehalococcoidales bacterium]|jgi:HD superfamily phosphodiesterase|nr:phosphohydrolase [Dehalococcoidales bacterium]MDP6126730.1 HD domain-containing protein [Dehalococcoidales bacterium]MDP6501303.1 HD domain-containing protein [Dehalococcoidales bacterium]MDP6633217.1 HD domain-containing protein [Dehalococcoidales bacterium]MDP7524741.1 HD domain-containing protein [Dehalococcoidales bacterium]|tara:strand:+ start:164 stop:667 length:504 start_codon:yes stop_codon:yes gene_type:complete